MPICSVFGGMIGRMIWGDQAEVNDGSKRNHLDYTRDWTEYDEDQLQADAEGVPDLTPQQIHER